MHIPFSNNALYLLLSVCGIIACIAADPTATIASGVLIGTTLTPSNAPDATMNAYLGVPYAKSPPERFSPPERPEAWSDPRNAKEVSAACPQDKPQSNTTLEEYLTLKAASSVQQSEDCLYLNVYAPQDASPSKLKEVMFWVHGGNLVGGSASESVYNGASLAVNADIVLVTINYRLNFFGFSNAPGNAGEQNSGFLDQRLALEWVRENINAFGGDPNKVTIFGESAGGYSVKYLLAKPPPGPPFRAAIIESQETLLPGNASMNYQNVSDHFGCSDIDCLRQVPWREIQGYVANASLYFKPVTDNVTYVADIRDSARTGEFANVPLLIGTNKDELSGVVWLLKERANVAGMQLPVDLALKYVLTQMLHLSDTITNIFINSLKALVNNNLTWESFSRMVTDTAFTCTTGGIANYTADHGRKVWRYRYSYNWDDSNTFPGQGAVHTAELPLVFGYYTEDQATDQVVALSRYMQDTWSKFVKDPYNGPGWDMVGTNQSAELADIGYGNSTGMQPIPFWQIDSFCGTLIKYAELIGVAW
ncbi:Carboxylesterase [Aspergillus avenaceus]|uniref:Carboxylic ester hydrolase n=1 Tax=Aspergillus avenaceus TaxID=36643 RepID=A0A5N6TVZ2_ASPAV|nr:Carboxylesterase [Aspergillus avenaceus]